MEFSRQESWSGLPFPPPRDLPNPGMEPGSPTLQVNSLPSEPKTHKVPLLGLKTQPRVFPGGPVVNISTFPLRGTRVPFLVGKLTYRMLHGTAESEVAQSCPTLCDPMDCSPPGSSVHGMLQARILERVAISSSKGSSQSRDLPNPGIQPASPAFPALAGGFFTTVPDTWCQQPHFPVSWPQTFLTKSGHDHFCWA